MEVSTFEKKVFELVNQERVKAGLPPLVLSDKLNKAADSHSENMANQDFFSHTGKDGSQAWDRAEKFGYKYSRMGENIAAGQRTPEQVVSSWMRSPGHRRNILSKDYTEIGIGHEYLSNDKGKVNYNHYWTQVFGKPLNNRSSNSSSSKPASSGSNRGSNSTLSTSGSEGNSILEKSSPKPKIDTKPEKHSQPKLLSSEGINKNGSNRNDYLRGTAKNDILRGHNGNDRLNGYSGKDILHGGNDNDKLRGGGDRDILNGGGGNDRLSGDGGQDWLKGGTGYDVFDFNKAYESGVGRSRRDIITDFQRNADRIDLRTIDAKKGRGNQAFNFIGMNGFSGTNGELRYSLGSGGVIVSGDIDGNKSADFQIQVTGLQNLSSNDFFL